MYLDAFVAAVVTDLPDLAFVRPLVLRPFPMNAPTTYPSTGNPSTSTMTAVTPRSTTTRTAVATQAQRDTVPITPTSESFAHDEACALDPPEPYKNQRKK